jgi:RNA polymerase sigma-70 factor (ECF subfamily)
LRVAPEDFERLILPHLDAAYNLARWLLRERADYEDVVQEAMVRAQRYFPGFRGGNERAWLLQIVRNTAYATLKARQEHRFVPLDDGEGDGETVELADPGDDPETALMRGQAQRRMGELLAALPLELRETIVLRELEELSYADIARITGTPIGTVMSRLWRARRALQRAVGSGRAS